MECQDRFSLSHHQSTREGVRIEAFAHNTLGGEAVFVASLSNSVLLIVRIGGRGGEDNDGSDSLRSWVLEWPVQGKARILIGVRRSHYLLYSISIHDKMDIWLDI